MTKQETDDSPKTSTQVLEDRVPRLLVIDDDEIICDLLKTILEEEGHKVDISNSSGAALENLIDYKYHVILLDINLPGISGHEILRYCKKNLPDTEIIIVSGNAEIDIAVNTVKQGAFDYIQKPFMFEEVISKVKSAIEKYSANLAKSGHFETVDSISPQTISMQHGYRILSSLGTGNMGMVLLVEKDGQTFAMKLLRQLQADEEKYEKRVKRFLREAKILSKLDDPNIVKIFEYGFPKDGALPFIVMEFIQGRALIDLMKEGSLSLKQKLSIIKDVASALSKVHKLKILHRDIKPSNVLVDQKLQAKLTDFGVARMSDSTLTMTYEILGSPVYMCPESFDIDLPLDERSDIFSLGILCYELITGHKPFNGESMAEIMESIQGEKPEAPHAVVPDLPLEVEEVVARMLFKRPRDRYRSAEEIVKAIDRLIDNAGQLAKPSSVKKILRSSFFSGINVWK